MTLKNFSIAQLYIQVLEMNKTLYYLTEVMSLRPLTNDEQLLWSVTSSYIRLYIQTNPELKGYSPC
jgi:hypothetical protein